MLSDEIGCTVARRNGRLVSLTVSSEAKMARRKTLTDNMILKEKPGAKRLTKPDPEMRGHYV